MQQSTLKKLSEVLGISISTVSRALKDHPDISASTKAKVKELAKAMEYEPNAYAVQLRTRQSNVLGILVPSIRNYFYDSFIAAVEEEARTHGYSVLIMQSGDKAEIEAANLHIMRKHMAMGVFVAVTVETEDMSFFQRMEELEVPLVFVDRVPTVGGFTKVSMADEEAARIAAEAIIEIKKQHVLALLGHPHLSLTQIREKAFTGQLQTKAPQAKLTISYPEYPEKAKEVTMDAFSQQQKPDVIFCMGDMILMGVMKAIHEMDLKVPEDVAIISISNGWIPTLYKPQITYVETSGYKLGKLAFAQMQKRLKQELVAENVCVPSSLVKGGSL
ncbi:MAG: LacI family DNA-binding transcriptional regulator [Chitinophagaceae bacterium]|nr:LacI family DNA-binding transcriptional regulator [Chitinophagaceae bacterium]